MPRRSYRPRRRSPVMTAALTAALLWGLAVGSVALVTDWSFYTAWIAGGSVATFLFYAFDKAQAQAEGRRVPELVLLGLVLLGGVIGGWIGLLLVRHKTRHAIFWVALVVGSVLHLGLAWWLSQG